MNKLKDKRKVIVYLLAVLCGAWAPLSLVVNPGWYTLALFYAPSFDLLMPVLIPVLVFVLAHMLRPKGWKLPVGLFKLEIVFSLLWILHWCFVVNGGDTEDSLHSILSRVFSGLWSEQLLIDLSPKLLIFTGALLWFFAFLTIFYKRQMSSAWQKWAWGLAMAHYAIFFGSSFIQTAMAQLGLTLDPRGALMNVFFGFNLLLSLLTIAYVVFYFKKHKNTSIKIRILGVLAFIWSLSPLAFLVVLALAMNGYPLY